MDIKRKPTPINTEKLEVKEANTLASAIPVAVTVSLFSIIVIDITVKIKVSTSAVTIAKSIIPINFFLSLESI